MIEQQQNVYLLFKVRDTFYGFELPYVQEVIQLPELKCTAKMPVGIAGFLNLREEVICVVDMPVTLGYPHRQYSLDDYIIILKDSDISFGVLVSEILDINQLSLDAEPDHELDHPSKKKNVLPLVSTIARFQSEIVFILDPKLIYEQIRQVYEDVNTNPRIHDEHPAEFNVAVQDKVVFVERAQALSNKLSQQLKTDTTPLTVINIHQEYFGIDPEIIKEFTRIEDFTPIPSTSAPPYLLGFINVRGEILTLIDVWQILKSQRLEFKKTSKILVINVNDLIVGVLVDDILDVIFVKPEEFRDVPLSMQKAHDEYIKHTVLYERDILGVLNLPKVIETIVHSAESYEK